MSHPLSIDEVFVKKLDDIIEVHLEDEQFGVNDLAGELGVSRSQLYRKLKILKGKSTSQYIREYRLGKAMVMLKNNVATASEIAYRVGFHSPSYFNTCFHQYFGFPPGEVKFRIIKDDDKFVSLQVDKGRTTNHKKKKKLLNFRPYAIAVLGLLFLIAFIYYIYARPGPSNTDNNKIIDDYSMSIAVLPFTNMSGNPEDEAFCNGMTTAIISRLSKIKDISKVISYTSVMGYKNSKKSIPEIAEELTVDYILEAGFQKSGNEIKINLQLIEGQADRLYWSQEYNGKYDSIFKIQAKVAHLVAQQLDSNISPMEQ